MYSFDIELFKDIFSRMFTATFVVPKHESNVPTANMAKTK